MLKHKQQNGFSLIDGLLVLILVGILAGTGWYVWQANKNADKNLNEANQVSSPRASINQPSAASYAGWKTYSSAVEGFSFKYPNNWTLVTNKTDGSSQRESITINGPNNFTIGYDVYQLNSNSNFDCQGCVFKNATSLSSVNYGKPLYIVINSSIVNGQPYQTLGISANKTLGEQSYKGWIYYPSFKNTGYVIRWAGDYVKTSAAGGELIYNSYGDFIKMPEVVIGMNILKSIRY